MGNTFTYERIDHPRYRYRLTNDYVHELAFRVEQVSNNWATLLPNRALVIKEGYCWDGLSKSPIEVTSSQRGSCVHDALCQLLRQGKLPYTPYRRYADKEMRRVWLQDKVSKVLAEIMYTLVRMYAVTH